MAMRYRCAVALPPFGAAAEPGHFDGCSVLVDDDQAFGIEVRLRGEPDPAPRGDVGPFLLAGVRGHVVTVEEAPYRAGRNGGTRPRRGMSASSTSDDTFRDSGTPWRPYARSMSAQPNRTRASSNAATQNSASMVFDKRQLSTQRVTAQ